MSKPAILVISESAPRYVETLRAALGDSVAIRAYRTSEEARATYCGQAVVLGEPHLVAAAAGGWEQLRWVQSTWAGITPLLPLARSGVTVTGVKGVFGPQMAEFVLGYLLARELKLLERVERQRAGEWWTEDNERLAGRTLGVLGTGSIGSHIATVVTALGVRTVGCSRSGDATQPFERVYPVADLPEFLSGLDYLVSVLPDTLQTDGLLSRDALACLPAHALLINVGRGSVLDEDALADALEAGTLGGAVLDVFREEPLPADHRFWTTPGLMITAHIAARSYPRDIGALFIDNYRRHVAGQPLLNRIEAERGY
jgi:phosphoglycerate dehydrogenase-like enzyme